MVSFRDIEEAMILSLKSTIEKSHTFNHVEERMDTCVRRLRLYSLSPHRNVLSRQLIYMKVILTRIPNLTNAPSSSRVLSLFECAFMVSALFLE